MSEILVLENLTRSVLPRAAAVMFAALTLEVAVAEDFEIFDWGEGRTAAHILVADVPQSEWETFFGQLREFAEANEFGIRIARLKPKHDIFYIDLWRRDAAMTGGNVFDTPEFHIKLFVDPDSGGSAEVAAALVEELKKSIAEVPGATLKQRK